ncbi:protein phosphatase 2C domain-containing protein [Nocardia salmonicida]|uniref:Protein phosphatase 2C domain-containing protein n=1 Tax=Nocardia salmonicida TaxID=53431 RepID=A0ABZ1NE01_9NOCA
MVVTDDAVIVLDGATAHDRSMPSAGEYVDNLAAELARGIGDASPLVEILERAIAKTAGALAIAPGLAPSSTVALVRVESDVVDALILGDSSVVFGLSSGQVMPYTDDRLSRLGLPEADLYRRFLAAGWGYTARHAKILSELQIAERARRNRPDGYWIAEAEPSAAKHALHVRFPRDDLSWIVVATDGAFDLLPVLGLTWPEVAQMATPQLGALLDRIHTWEAEIDPDGQALPRAKRHDDKTVVAIRL